MPLERERLILFFSYYLNERYLQEVLRCLFVHLGFLKDVKKVYYVENLKKLEQVGRQSETFLFLFHHIDDALLPEANQYYQELHYLIHFVFWKVEFELEY